jgi:hypothetical protein
MCQSSNPLISAETLFDNGSRCCVGMRDVAYHRFGPASGSNDGSGGGTGSKMRWWWLSWRRQELLPTVEGS